MDNLAFRHGGNIYEAEKKYKRKFLDFSANINPLGLPPQVKKTVCEHFDRILHYPDIEAKDITQKIAKYWGIKDTNILVGNGSAELIYLITFAFKPHTTLIPTPTFSEYERAARAVKGRIKFLKLKEKESFRLNSLDVNSSDMLFLCNPNNPTGNIILNDYQMIEKLPNKLIVVDEAFMDFLPDEKKHTLIWRAQEDKRIIVLRTFTKMFSLPGLRMGYLIAHKDIIKRLKQYQPPWSTNSLAQLAAEVALKDKSHIRKSVHLIEKERRFLSDEIIKIKQLKLYPSVTNFLLIKIEDERMTSTRLKERLLKKGILIRDCANFRGLDKQFIRVAVRLHKENIRLMRALEPACRQTGSAYERRI